MSKWVWLPYIIQCSVGFTPHHHRPLCHHLGSACGLTLPPYQHYCSFSCEIHFNNILISEPFINLLNNVLTPKWLSLQVQSPNPSPAKLITLVWPTASQSLPLLSLSLNPIRIKSFYIVEESTQVRYNLVIAVASTNKN